MKTPNITRAEVQQLLDENNISSRIALVGIRGYYLRTMGDASDNDRGIYDDAIIIIAPKLFLAFAANVDPSIFRKGIATLKAGIYSVVKHRHKGKYAALQIVRDVVNRDGISGDDAGRHGINFHYGGESQTWSEGCQTLPKSIYPTFLNSVYSLMDSYKLNSIVYLLIENKGASRTAPETKKTAPIPVEMPRSESVRLDEVLQRIEEFEKTPCAEESEAQTETPIKATTGKARSFWISVFGIFASSLTTAFGFVQENWKIILIGILGIVLLGITISVSFTVINYLKMRIAANPNLRDVE